MKNYDVCRYSFGNGFYVEEIFENDVYEYWIGKDGFGVKDFAFGVPYAIDVTEFNWKEYFLDFDEIYY